MTDDIVTRLRDWANRLYPMQYGACMEQAADEIERLREAMRLMYAHYHADDGAELVVVYEKAVRGD